MDGRAGEIQKKHIKKIINAVSVILTMMVIFRLSSENAGISLERSNRIVELLKKILPNNTNYAELSHTVRKTAHFLLYFFLGLFWQGAILNGQKRKKRDCLVVFLVFLYAYTDEFHQKFVTGRGASFTDVFIDTLGGIFSVLVVETIRKLKKVVK